MDLSFEPGLDFAHRLDEQDKLAGCREHFVIDDPQLIYLDGNSLGRLTTAARQRLSELVNEEWGGGLIRGWNRGWMDAPRRLGDKIAGLIGARPGEVLVCDSTSVNLYKLVLAALELRPGRLQIVTDTLNFPSDLYVLQGAARLLGGRHRIDQVPARDGLQVTNEDLAAALGPQTALLTLCQVTFKSGFLYDVEAVTRAAHEAGALVLWDLSHSVGVVPAELDRWGVDFAVGCTYKYLNGGPGAPAFLYVREELQQQAVSPIWGWLGEQAPFAFGLDYRPAAGIGHFMAGTPPVLSLLAVEAALEPLLAVGVGPVREKSIGLTEYLIFLYDTILDPLGFTLGSPRDAARRGSHVSIRHPEGYRINRALIDEMAVLPDFREPDNIRLGLAPLYTSYAEVWEAVDRIRRVMVENRYQKYPAERLAVT